MPDESATFPEETGSTPQGVTRWKPRAAVEAWQLTEGNVVAVADWISDSGTRCDQYASPAQIVIRQAGRPDAKADVDDWIVRGWRGAFWVVLDGDFTETYEPAERPAESGEVKVGEVRALLAKSGVPRADDTPYAIAAAQHGGSLLVLTCCDGVSVPQEAFTAAMQALHRTGCGCGNDNHPASARDVARLRIALEAAAPHMTEASYMAGVAAERERIRELAIEYAARCRRPGAHYATPFADLIREHASELEPDHYVTFYGGFWGTEHPVSCQSSGEEGDCVYHAAVRRVIGRGAPVAGRWRITGLDSEGLPSLVRADADGDARS